VRSPDRPAIAADGDAEIATDTAPPGSSETLGSAITREYPTLVRSAEIQVSKSGLAHGRDEIVSLADDLLSGAVARAMERADRWSPDGPVWPWIARFVANLIHERIRERARERQHVAQPALADELGSIRLANSLVDPASLAKDQLFELLDLVGEPDRSLLRLAHVDGLTGEEIARHVGMTHANVRVRLTRARKKLHREYLAAEQGDRA
jgi:RNA polymerase sigma-70 factor (ECF subfamily)